MTVPLTGVDGRRPGEPSQMSTGCAAAPAQPRSNGAVNRTSADVVGGPTSPVVVDNIRAAGENQGAQGAA
jgi:hypothetical protein